MHTSIIEIYAYIKIWFHVMSSEKRWYSAELLASLLNYTKDADPFLRVWGGCNSRDGFCAVISGGSARVLGCWRCCNSSSRQSALLVPSVCTSAPHPLVSCLGLLCPGPWKMSSLTVCNHRWMSPEEWPSQGPSAGLSSVFTQTWWKSVSRSWRHFHPLLCFEGS